MEPLSRRALSLSVGASALVPGAVRAATPTPALTDEAIRQILVDRIEVRKKSLGMVVGLTSREGRRVIGYGVLDRKDRRVPGADTVFAVGSVTKLFTALILADMARRGEVALGDPVARYLPAAVPQRNGRQITLVDLATHTSGLPFWPSNLAPPPPENAQHYTEAQLYAFLAGYQLTRDPGSQWEYSNLGFALLGHALARRAGLDYATLLGDRITRPLGMRDTGVMPSPAMRSRLAMGHDEALQPTRRWNFGLFAPAGGALSTVNDLLSFAEMTMAAPTASPLAAASALMLQTRVSVPIIEGQQALGWEIRGRGEGQFLNKDGVEVGFTASIVCAPATGDAVVVLSNSVIGAADIARHLLRPALPLAKAYKVITLPREALDAYVGQYRPGPGFTFTVSRAESFLLLQLPSAPRFPIKPIGPAAFVVEEVGLELEFQRDPAGRVAGMVLHVPGRPPIAAARVP
ncbi:MAG: serine hydrolase [Phenylobacterium sp.]